jgi:cyclophilin family peptidyl-prolyl cis-trans isomerase
MKNTILSLVLVIGWTSGLAAETLPAHPQISVETTEGNFVLELDGKRAPLTVRNFLNLVASGHYDGTIFHRVIPGFMVQGGGYTPDLKERESVGTIPNESGNGLSNSYGSVAMARLSEPHTAGAQFFINVADNMRLDPGPNGWGYAVFGYVIEGMGVVDKIAAMRTGPAGRFKSDVPVVPVVIKKMTRVLYED